MKKEYFKMEDMEEVKADELTKEELKLIRTDEFYICVTDEDKERIEKIIKEK